MADVAEFKGMENQFVIMTDFHDVTNSPDVLNRFYVGMTRARAGLWLVLTEDTRGAIEQLQTDHLSVALHDAEALVAGKTR
jgi:ATP-dependent exoDNAse (exonuclease V) beta subunit